MNWVQVVLFVIAVMAIAVAWWGIAKRVVKQRTRKGLARIDVTPSDDQLLGLMLHKQDDARIRQATGELDAGELRAAIDDIQAEQAAGDDSGSATA